MKNINFYLYREEILEEAQNPKNFGRMRNFDKSAKQLNPFCGDEIKIWVKFNSKGKSAGVNVSHPEGAIEEIRFQGKGCVISMAAASILTEYTKGKTKKQLTNFSEKDMLALLRIEISETRKKCALLALTALRDCLCLK